MVMLNYGMKNLYFLVLLIFCVISFLGNTDLYGQNVWTAENSPYYVNSDTIVSDLTIEPGVEVLFTDNFSFTINADFKAIGAQYDSIYFKPAPGNSNGWKGIIFDSSSPGLKLDFCLFSGASASGININSGFVTITNSVSTNNTVRGLNVTNGTVSVINSEFKNNGSYGVYLGTTANVTLYATRISNNGSYGINSPSGNLEAYNTIIDHNSGYGLYTNGGNIKLYNVVISNNNTGLILQNGSVDVISSVIYTNGAQSILYVSGTINVNYSDIEGGYTGIGNIDMDPGFIGKNYELSEIPASPCIDEGNIDPTYNDIYFPPSKGNNANDMGAYGGPHACKWYYPLYTNPDTINYGNVDYNESVSESITINNYSGEILNLDSISITGANKDKFLVVSIPVSFPVILGINESKDFEIEFTPEMANASPYEAILNFVSENGTKAVHLEGRGVQADIFIDPEIEENGYDFGNIDVGDSTDFDLVISNFGTGTLRVHDFTTPDESVNIENFEAFELAPNPALSETLVVKYKPVKADTLEGNLIIISNDPQNGGSLPIALSGIGMAPEISSDHVNVNFEDVDVDSIKSSSITLINAGNKNLIVSKAFLSGPDTNQFNILTEIDSDTLLIPNESMNLELEFAPKIRTVLISTLNILSNDPNTDTLKIPIQGSGVAAEISVDPDPVNFGDILKLEDSQIEVIIGNAGEKQLDVDTLYLKNGDDSEFTLTADSTSFSIRAGGDSHSIHIGIDAETEGTFYDQIIIKSNDYLEDTLSIDISVNVVTPHIFYDGDEVDLGNVWRGESLNFNKIIHNTGSAALKLKNIQISGAENDNFILQSEVDSLIIEPDQKDSIEIRYTPQKLETEEAQLKFITNVIDSTNITINLKGRGVAAIISGNPGSLDFGSIKTDSSATKSFIISNTGNINLEVTEFLIENDKHGAFQVEMPSMPLIVAPETQSDSIKIEFDPDDRMNLNAILNVISNAYQEDTLKIDLHATSILAGVPYLFLFDDSVHNIGNAVITGDSLFPLVIENLSDDTPLVIENIKISGQDSSAFFIESANELLTIEPLSSSDQRKLIFSPTELKTYACTLTIHSNDTIDSPHEYTIYANGVMDETPPIIRLDSLATQLSLNTNGKFQTRIRDQESTIGKVVLYIRKTAVNNFDSLALMSDDQFIWSIDLTSDLVTKYGLEYYLRIEHGGIESYYPSTYKTKPAALSVEIPEFNFPYNTLSNDYQMISVPFNSKKQTLGELFGDELGSYDNTKYRIFDWNPLDSIFEEQKEMDAELPAGKALYLITKKSKQLNITDCQTVLSSETFTIYVHEGWNMISIPYAFNILWSDIYESPNTTDLVYWTGTEMINPTVLEPFKGYGFHADSNGTLVIPAIEADLSKIAKQNEILNDGEWYFQIEAQCGRYADRYNFAGVRSNSHDDLDNWDSYEPPGIGDHISLFFTENTKDDKQVKLCADYKNKNNEYYQYDFEYKSTISGKTLLNLASKNLPDTYDWGVIAREGDILLPKGEISSSQRNRQYRLIVGNSEYLNSIKSEFKILPEKFSVSQNYPNPFNPVTKITIAVPKEAYITADIYNILGKRVKRIANGVLISEGYHDFSWDGKNEHNFLVSSGIYFFTFRTSNYVKTIKMILQK